MPMDRSRYPTDWERISLRIRSRDGWRCKFCGVPNGAIGVRDRDGTFFPVGHPRAIPGKKPTKIVLTVAHLGTARADGRPGDKHDKMDVRDENLAALCQGCHLMYDLEDHMANAAATRRQKKIDAGQLVLGS